MKIVLLLDTVVIKMVGNVFNYENEETVYSRYPDDTPRGTLDCSTSLNFEKTRKREIMVVIWPWKQFETNKNTLMRVKSSSRIVNGASLKSKAIEQIYSEVQVWQTNNK